MRTRLQQATTLPNIWTASCSLPLLPSANPHLIAHLTQEVHSDSKASCSSNQMEHRLQVGKKVRHKPDSNATPQEVAIGHNSYQVVQRRPPVSSRIQLKESQAARNDHFRVPLCDRVTSPSMEVPSGGEPVESADRPAKLIAPDEADDRGHHHHVERVLMNGLNCSPRRCNREADDGEQSRDRRPAARRLANNERKMPQAGQFWQTSTKIKSTGLRIIQEMFSSIKPSQECSSLMANESQRRQANIDDQDDERENGEQDEEKRRRRRQKARKHTQPKLKMAARSVIALSLLLTFLAAASNLKTPAPFASGPIVSLCSAQELRAASGNQQVAQSAGGSQPQPSGCPYPPTNANCQVNIIAQAPAVPLVNAEFVADEYSSLKPDTQAAYKCDHGYELLGSEQITCLASGRWSAPPPNCVTNIAPGKPTNQSSTVRGGESRNANDAKLITQHDSRHCTETKVDQSPWWQIDLLQVYEIRLVRLLGRACCNPQLSLHDIEIRVGNSSSLQGNRLCAWSPNPLDEGVPRDFQCANPILGRFVSIQMVGIESALSLCEVMVFSSREFPSDRCAIQSTLAPSSGSSTSPVTTTTTSATTTAASGQQTTVSGAQDNQIVVFNRTCYETQATSGGSFLAADTYCKARGGSLMHSVTDLTHLFISQELERLKSKLKSKLVWLGAKREQSSPNALGPITSGSTSALLVPSDSLHHRNQHTFALHETPIESLFSNEHGLISSGEISSIFGGGHQTSARLSRAALFQASSGAGGATSRGSQTFGLQTSQQKHQHTNGTTHTGRSLIISQPSQVVASFFQPPVPISNAAAPSPPTVSVPSPSSSLPISLAPSPSAHIHRTLRPPSLASTPAPGQPLSSSSWNPSRLLETQRPSTSSQESGPSQTSPSSSSSSSSSWRWIGDSASDTLMSPITQFLWAEDQPNNYNNQQDCIVMDGAKRWLWNDVTCELDYLPWVCQYRPATCGSPDRHENSTILELSALSTSSQSETTTSDQQQAFQLGKVITYACPAGHRLQGSRTRKCLYDGTWSGRAPRCHYVNCGPIQASNSAFENGRVVYLNQSQTTFGSQARYVCYEDYVLVGDDTRQCQTDGKWAGKQPYCAYKWCPVLQAISNGQLNVTSYSENSLAIYQCNSGYKLIGNDTRQCLLGGKWTNQEPFCQYVECGQPKPISNGAFKLLNGTTNYLSVVQYSCNENYTLAGGPASNKLVCSHNNRWTGREPQCALINCGQPQALPGSRFSGDSFTVHSSIEYRCEPGFKEVAGSVQRTCGLDGQWSGQPLTCKYLDCGRVPAILKGEVVYTNGTTYLASQVAYECTPGNRIAGHKVRFCGPDGRWTGSSPKCEEVRCEAPELPANGSALYIGNDRSFKEQSFSVGVTVQYECDYGHVVTGSWSSRLCQASGEWSGEPPVCKFVDCGQVPSIENGLVSLRHPPSSASAVGSATQVELMRRSDGDGAANTGSVGTYYGTIAHYSCEPNYKLVGPAQRECLESGQWRRPLPTCEPIQCPKPEFFDEHTQVALLPKGGGHDTNQPSETLSSASLKASLNKLIANNQWLHPGQTPTFNVGDKLLYSCAPGHELYGGPEWRTCTQYAQWSGSSTPRCRLIDCGRPAPIGQEGRFFLLNETTTFNSIVEYSCVRPFKLVEVKIRQAGNLIETLMNAQAGVTQILTALPIGVKICANNGQWMPNDQQPKCTSATSGVAGQFDGGDNTLDGGHRQVVVVQHHPSLGSNQEEAGDGNSLDSSASGRQQQQQQSGSQSAFFWAKVLLVISLPLMFAIITVTLICIRSKKKPKQRNSGRASSILSMSAGQQAALQIQLANGGGGSGGGGKMMHQQQQSLMVQQQAHMVHRAGIVGHVPNAMLANQLNGALQKMPPTTMVGQSQMSSGADFSYHHQQMLPMTAYGDMISSHHPDGGRAMVLMNGKSSSLGVLEMAGGAVDAHADSYSRLTIDSASGQANLGNKTIRHNPNGLVTFVSPHPQQQQKQPKSKGASETIQQQQSSGSSSTSSGVSSSGRNQHQISPQSISTPLSVSSSAASTTSSASMSPSSNLSSSAQRTNATRLSASAGATTDSNDSPVGGHHQLQHFDQQHHHHHHHQYQQQQSEYEAPQQFHHQTSAPPQQPPSLPAHPPPPHRVQQQFKQMLRHQQATGSKQQVSLGATSSPSDDQSRAHHQQEAGTQNGGGPADHHYMEPAI